MPFRTPTLAVLLAALGGCAPVISLEEFPDVANGFALDPTKTCLEAARDFGLPPIKGVHSPADIGLDFREEWITLDSGDTLRGWFVPAANEQGVVVFSYGAIGDMSCYLWLVLNIVERGWSVAIYDFRGFGESSGTASLEHLADDGRAAIEWARQTSGADRVVLMGVSLGTIPSITYAAEHPEVVQAIILDGPISLQAEVERFSPLLGMTPDPYVRIFADELRIEKRIGSVTAPLLAFSYGRDEFATGKISGSLLAGSGGPVEEHRFEDLPHVRAPYYAEDEYFAVLAEFLLRFAREPATQPVVDLGSAFDYVTIGE